MIIIGHQGIGKTSLSIQRDNTIDLDSSCFYVGYERVKDWFIAYRNVAMSLSRQGNTVFVSSHKEVRSAFALVEDEVIVLCYPAPELKEPWQKKLRERYARTGSAKDKRAMLNADGYYDQNIKMLMNDKRFENHIVITSMDYDLEKLIEEYEP